MSQFSFRVALVLVVVVSFAVLVARSRPLARFGVIEPLLFATGLHQPHGLTFREDGTLLIAEAGGLDAASELMPGRVTVLGPTGQVVATAVDTATPAAASSVWSATGPSAIVGRSPFGNPVVFAGPVLPGQPARLLRLIAAGSEVRLDQDRPLPVAGTPWSATAGPGGALLFTVPERNQLLRLQANGTPDEAASVAVVTGFLGSNGSNPLPTGVAFGPDGVLYVALFATVPGEAGSGKVVRIEPDGRWQPVFESFSFPVALAFSPSGQLYVLEFSRAFDTRSQRFLPGSGRVIAISPAPSRRRVVLRDVSYPTAIAFSPAGDLFVTEHGAQSLAGLGQILQVPAPSLPGPD